MANEVRKLRKEEMSLTNSDKDNHRKALAMILVLFLCFVYIETVWKPYFYGYPAAQNGAANQQVATEPTPAPTVIPGAEFLEPKSDLGAGADFAETTRSGTEVVAAGAAEKLDSAAPAQVAPTSKGGALFPSDAQVDQAGAVLVSTKDLTAEISLLGGRLTDVLLNNYAETREKNSPPLSLVEHVEYAPYPLGVTSGDATDVWTEYHLVSNAGEEAMRVDVTGNEPQVLIFEGALSDGRSIRKTFTFHPDGFFIDLDVELGSAAPASSSRVQLEWTEHVTSESTSSLFDAYNVSGFTWFDGEKAQRLSFSKFEEPKQDLGELTWVSLGGKYFVAALLSRGERVSGSILKTAQLFRARVLGDSEKAAISMYLGPKSYRSLKKIGYGLERNIDFGWTGFVGAPLMYLLFAIEGVFGNYGLAIVVLTILVKLCLYPLNAASFKQMKAMQDLRPDMERIKEAVSDKQEQQQKLMELYKKKGVNPLGGCLPMALQMPIFIGLYSSLQLSVELRHAPYVLWIQDLSAPESLIIAGVGVPVMVLMFVVSMMVQQWTTPSQMDPTQKKVMMVLPIVFGFMFARLPAGLTLYFLTNNFISIGQQKALLRKNSNGRSAFKITLAVSASVFAFAFIVSLL